MENPTLSESNFKLWLLIAETAHQITLVRQRELIEHHIPHRQLYVLHIIEKLGSKATLSEVTKQAQREAHVISRQVIRMEKDGLVKRIKSTPKSNLLRLELTQNGLDMIEVARKSKAIDVIFSFLSKKERQQMESSLSAVSTQVRKYYLQQPDRRFTA